MSGEFIFRFEELPLVVEDGFEAGLVNGEATISYHDDGEWFIRSISLDGHKRAVGVSPGGYFQRQVEIDNQKSEIYLSIFDRLSNGSWADSITDRVAEELAEGGVA